MQTLKELFEHLYLQKLLLRCRVFALKINVQGFSKVEGFKMVTESDIKLFFLRSLVSE